MPHVQIAIRDKRYARALRDLLLGDGMHRVDVVDHPSAGTDGVVVADEKLMDRLYLSKTLDLSRFIVFIRELSFDANKLFEAGVRYVIHANSPPDIARLVVIAAERQLDQAAKASERDVTANIDLTSMFDATDKLFLQALRISDH